MTNKRIIFRVDCNPTIASGHLMRCISIAQKAQDENYDVVFVMSDSDSKSLLDAYGFNLIALNSNWKNLDEEIPLMIELASKEQKDILFIDTYSVTSTYTESLQYIYDIVYLGSKQILLPGIKQLINYSTNIDYLFYNKYGRSTALFLGPLYSPLRKEFQNFRKREVDKITNVLVTTGNTDKNNFTGKLLEKIATEISPKIKFEIVVGNLFTHTDELESLKRQHENFNLNYGITRITDLFSKCQFAISANGTTVYELCACGIPTISVAIVEEQMKSGESMCDLGMVDFCGLFESNDDIFISSVVDKLKKYLNNPDLSKALVHHASELIDVRGCERIVDNLKLIN